MKPLKPSNIDNHWFIWLYIENPLYPNVWDVRQIKARTSDDCITKAIHVRHGEIIDGNTVLNARCDLGIGSLYVYKRQIMRVTLNQYKLIGARTSHRKALQAARDMK